MSALVLAIPSKGRLQEESEAFFARAGLPIRRARGERGYRGHIAGLDGVEVAFLSASEIAREIAAGGAHLGVTGEDLVREETPDPESLVHFVTPLGFGRAEVVVAVPDAWLDVRLMDDLDDVAMLFRMRHGRRLRIATKYSRLTRAFFARHRVRDYRIVESLGATEGAPAAGAAEAIVDISTTGATLAANGLRILDDGLILKSEAHLVASLNARWGESERARLTELLGRIAAEDKARRTRFVRIESSRTAAIVAAARERFGAAIRVRLEDADVAIQVKEEDAFALAAFLREAGAEIVAVEKAEAVFERSPPLLSRLLTKI